MKQAIHFIARVYTRLVRFYPASYRAQFEEEMAALFCELMTDAAEKGHGALFVVCFREFWDLPANLIDAHLSNRSGGETAMLKTLFDKQSLHTARWGAVGFGLGFAFIFLARYVLQAFSLNNVGDFFTVWILGLGTILYGIAGGLGGALLGVASASAEDVRERRAWNHAWRCAVAGFFALALGWFVTTIHIPFLLSSSASFPVRAAVEGAFTHLLKPLSMGTLITAFISIIRSGRTFPLRWLLAGAVAFELGGIGSYYVAQPFLLTMQPFIEPWFGLPSPLQSDGYIKTVGFLGILVDGMVSGALLGLVFGQRKTDTHPQLAG